MKRAIRVAGRIVIGLLAVLLLAVLAITLDGLSDRVVTADLAVVPGNTVNRDGTPSHRLQGRLDAALALFVGGRCKFILASGGVGSEGFDEAAVMKRYLVAHGVPQDRIFTDNKGFNTAATARNAAAVMRANHLHSAIAVSQFFHVPRLRLALQGAGVSVAGNAHARYFEPRDLYSVFREVFGYAEYFVRQHAA